MKLKSMVTIFLMLSMLVVFPMIMPGPDGRPIMTIRDWLPDQGTVEAVTDGAQELVYDISEMVQENTGVDMPVERPKLYRWQDASGRWHFSDEPPPKEAVAKEAMAVPEVVNLVPATKSISRPVADKADTGAPMIPLPTTVPVTRIPQLIDDAKKVQELVNQRQQALEQAQ